MAEHRALPLLLGVLLAVFLTAAGAPSSAPPASAWADLDHGHPVSSAEVIARAQQDYQALAPGVRSATKRFIAETVKSDPDDVESASIWWSREGQASVPVGLVDQFGEKPLENTDDLWQQDEKRQTLASAVKQLSVVEWRVRAEQEELTYELDRILNIKRSGILSHPFSARVRVLVTRTSRASEEYTDVIAEPIPEGYRPLPDDEADALMLSLTYHIVPGPAGAEAVSAYNDLPVAKQWTPLPDDAPDPIIKLAARARHECRGAETTSEQEFATLGFILSAETGEWVPASQYLLEEMSKAFDVIGDGDE